MVTWLASEPLVAFQPLAGKDDITSYEENTRPYLEACYSASAEQIVAFSTTEKQHLTWNPKKLVVCTPLKFNMERLKKEIPFGNHQISDVCLSMQIFRLPNCLLKIRERRSETEFENPNAQNIGRKAVE